MNWFRLVYGQFELAKYTFFLPRPARKDLTLNESNLPIKLKEYLNPNWLRKQEKCSSLAPPRNIFYNTQWAWQGVKLTRLMSIFTSKKVWKFLIKIQLIKYDPKRTRGWKVPSLMPIRIKPDSPDFWSFLQQFKKQIQMKRAFPLEVQPKMTSMFQKSPYTSCAQVSHTVKVKLFNTLTNKTKEKK